MHNKISKILTKIKMKRKIFHKNDYINKTE